MSSWLDCKYCAPRSPRRWAALRVGDDVILRIGVCGYVNGPTDTGRGRIMILRLGGFLMSATRLPDPDPFILI